MLKAGHLRTQPELCDLERFFCSQIILPEIKVSPIQLPFYNFVCYVSEMMSTFVRTNLQVGFNVFLVDQHVRKYGNSVELYRRFMGFIGSWKKYGETDQGKLLATFLLNNRNQKKNIRLFLKLRKILLKNINQKILQQINLTHEDVVTIIHTLDMLTQSQRKLITKKINDYFISKNVKYLNTVILNAAVFCEFLMVQINDRSNQAENYSSNLSNKITKILNSQADFIEEAEESSRTQKDIWLTAQDQDDQIECQGESEKAFSVDWGNEEEKQNAQGDESKRSLVNLQKCMKELTILKQKDMEIDNRFKKLSKSNQQKL